ncbi:MAG: cytochrome c oxidase assembly protein, partial [Acidobacteriota bacterium]|nr:cytochrome c oxidase assembly protein [Acidobacteriota bacterium]
MVGALAALAALLFAQGVIRLRRRGRRVGWDRIALFALGLAASVFALVGRMDTWADTHLAVHMAQHVVIGDAAVAVMVLAVRGPLLVFMLPAPVLVRVAKARAFFSLLLRPRVAFSLWAANLATWHVPYLYDAALRHRGLHDVEHGCWVVAGLLVWTLLVDPGSHRRLTVGGRIALAAAMFACGQILADVLVFSFHPVYPAYPGRLDQQLAGVVMMGEQL